MSATAPIRRLAALALAALLGACATTETPPAADGSAAPILAEEGPAASAADPAPRPGEGAGTVVVTALNFLGVRYRRGGESAEQGFDCSGFTRHVYATAAGLQLPRRSYDQAQAREWRKVERGALEPGDLVFFNTLRAAFSHVGIYVGEGRFIHAPRTGAAVRLEDMGTSYWRKRYEGARRAPWPAQAGPAAFH